MAYVDAAKKPRSTLMIVLLVIGGVLVLGIIAIVLMAALGLPILARAREAGRRVSSASNLSQIGMAMNLYADSQTNKTSATDPSHLYPKFVSDRRVFKRNGYPAGHDFHYTMIAGVRPDDGDILTAFENPPIKMQKVGRNVLRANGKVEWLSEEQFIGQLAITEKQLNDAKRLYKIVPISLAKLESSQ